MLNIFKNTQIYVYCPANHVTGGAELLHQLVDKLNCYSLNAFIIYSQVEAKIPDEYSLYNIKVTDHIIDNEQNIVVIYEGIFDNAFKTKNAQLILWWLSVDNFYYCSTSFLSIYDYLKWKPIYGINLFLRRIASLIIKQRNIFAVKSIKDLKSLDAINCYQSEYAQNFLLNKKFKRLAPLTDYINSDLINTNQIYQKENIVLYNPKKGYKFTQRIIKHAPSITWKPIIGMDRKQLVNTFQQSKLYIDFGYHPGKDRIPREAAINNCCIITGIQGSAGFFEDVSIPNCYKIDEKKVKISNIITIINDILTNYEKHTPNFEFYRNKIKNEKLEFDIQVRNLFKI